MRKLDAPAADHLLIDGASANARDTKEPPPTFSTLLQRLLARLQHKPDDAAKESVDALTVLMSKCYFEYDGEETSEKDAPYERIAVALIHHKADTHVRLERRVTPLHVAASYRLHQTVRLLVSQGVDVNARDDDGGTPLMDADAENTLLLIQHGARVNARDSTYGRTPLYYAAIHGRSDG